MQSSKTLVYQGQHINDKSLEKLNSHDLNLDQKHIDHLTHLITIQNQAKHNVSFYNLWAQGRFETISGIINLFLLCVLITFVTDPDGPLKLGYVCLAQVCLFYVLLIPLKAWVIPRAQRKLAQVKTQGFTLYSPVYNGYKALKDYSIPQLQLIENTAHNRNEDFGLCFPKISSEKVIDEINQILKFKSSFLIKNSNHQLQALKQRQKNAKYWYNFWNVFVPNKCYTINGLVMLMLIILPLTISERQSTGLLAEGWLSVAFAATGFFVYFLLKFALEGPLDSYLEYHKSQAFVTYNWIYLKVKQLKFLDITQLEQIQNAITYRQAQFQKCFPQVSSYSVLSEVNGQLKKKLPKKGNQSQQIALKQVYQKQILLKKYHDQVLAFLSNKLISLIINTLKWFIVLAITLIPHYSEGQDLKNGQIVIGAVGVGVWGFGYLLFLFLKGFLIDYLDDKYEAANSSGFRTYRLVYFGNKQLNNLETFELQDIREIIKTREQQFKECFPKTLIDHLLMDIQSQLKKRQSLNRSYLSGVRGLLKNQRKARQRLAFWINFSDDKVFTSMYSIIVLLVLLIVSTVSVTYDKLVLGYLGVGFYGYLFTALLILKCWFLNHLSSKLKQYKIDGFSEYNLVYNKLKQLKDVNIFELQKIQQIISQDVEEFKRCFPKTKPTALNEQIKLLINFKRSKNQAEPKSSQIQRLITQRDYIKNILQGWTNLINNKLYVVIPVQIVIFILLGQTVVPATNKYNASTALGSLMIAGLGIFILMIIFVKLWYQKHLNKKICHLDNQIYLLQNKNHLTVKQNVWF